MQIREPQSLKTGHNAPSKSFDSCQPARTAQADMSRNFLLFLIFTHLKQRKKEKRKFNLKI